MESDYYQILGVNPTDDVRVIKEAYRRKAMQHHPDRGGTHEEMVRVQEAWEVLSNAEHRRRYDEARAASSTVQARRAARTDAQEARQRAEQYPRTWSDMEAMFTLLANDFSRATYGSVRMAQDIYLPTAGASVTGWLFILGGAILGGVFVSPMVYNLGAELALKAPNLRTISICTLISIVFPVIGGAWIGATIHKWFRDVINILCRIRCPNPECGSIFGWDGKQCGYCGTTAAPPSSPGSNGQQHEKSPDPASPKTERANTHIVVCEKCGQKLRFPDMAVELELTCKSCDHKFGWKPPTCQ